MGGEPEVVMGAIRKIIGVGLVVYRCFLDLKLLFREMPVLCINSMSYLVTLFVLKYNCYRSMPQNSAISILAP